MSTAPEFTATTMRIVCDGPEHAGQDVLVEVMRRDGSVWVGRTRQQPIADQGTAGTVVGHDVAEAGRYLFWCPRCYCTAFGPRERLQVMLDILAEGGVSKVSLETLQLFLTLHSGTP